ncbi:acid protease [Amylostereum chailletii]|nr:acid protease [Amylostereum chailletii]
MRLSLPLACLLSALATSALKVPLRKVNSHNLHARSSSPYALLPRDADDVDLSTVNDMLYIANITLAGQEYLVQLDTGSSDLWIKGASSSLPNTNQTSISYNLTYGAGWASGNVAYAPVQFAGINISQQAFIDASAAENAVLNYGTSGVMGLGFTSLSTIDALVNRTKQSTGRSLLYNLFADNPSEPNFIAFSLQRSSDSTDDVEGQFMIGEVDPDYADVNKSTPISTFPISNPSRWNVLLEALFIGSDTISLSSTVDGAPSGNAVVLLDSGSSYTYAPTSIVNQIYGGISGAEFNSKTSQWTVPCNAEIDMAFQFNGQVFPLHPLDVVVKSTQNTDKCVGTFIPQDVSSIGGGILDWIAGDNFLRSVYSVYDFGDFDSSGKMGNPYIKLLSLTNPNEASADFAAARNTQARTNITYNAASGSSSSGTTVSISDDLADTINKVKNYFPAILAVMALNALVIILILVAGIVYLCRRHRGRSLVRPRKNKGRATPIPMPMEPLNTDSFVEPLRGPMQHQYEPVSMALTEDTFVPPSPAFRGGFEGGFKGGKSPIERPMSVA